MDDAFDLLLGKTPSANWYEKTKGIHLKKYIYKGKLKVCKTDVMIKFYHYAFVKHWIFQLSNI